MECKFFCLVVLSGVLMAVDGNRWFYKKYPPITDKTKFERLPEPMQPFVKNMFEAKKKLDAVTGSGVMARFQRCKLRFTIDQNGLYYLFFRWTTPQGFMVQTKDGKSLRTDLGRFWYTPITTYVAYMKSCMLGSKALRQDTFVLKTQENPQEKPKTE